jgi:curved DNA-binding protein CbpA
MWFLVFTLIAFSKTPFEELGVSPNATAGEIKQARKTLILKYHPDRAPPGKEAEFTERLKRINNAYDEIKDHLPKPKVLSAEEEAFEKMVKEFGDDSFLQSIRGNPKLYSAFTEQMAFASTEPRLAFLRLHLNYLWGKKEKLGSEILASIVKSSLANSDKALDVSEFSSYGRALEKTQNVFEARDLKEHLGGEYTCGSFFGRLKRAAGIP